MATRTITITVEAEGDLMDIREAVDWALDDGNFQDMVNEYARETGRDARIVSVTVSGAGS